MQEHWTRLDYTGLYELNHCNFHTNAYNYVFIMLIVMLTGISFHLAVTSSTTISDVKHCLPFPHDTMTLYARGKRCNDSQLCESLEFVVLVYRADAFAEAKAQKRAHRFIKPSNVANTPLSQLAIENANRLRVPSNMVIELPMNLQTTYTIVPTGTHSAQYTDSSLFEHTTLSGMTASRLAAALDGIAPLSNAADEQRTTANRNVVRLSNMSKFSNAMQEEKHHGTTSNNGNLGTAGLRISELFQTDNANMDTETKTTVFQSMLAGDTDSESSSHVSESSDNDDNNDADDVGDEEEGDKEDMLGESDGDDDDSEEDGDADNEGQPCSALEVHADLSWMNASSSDSNVIQENSSMMRNESSASAVSTSTVKNQPSNAAINAALTDASSGASSSLTSLLSVLMSDGQLNLSLSQRTLICERWTAMKCRSDEELRKSNVDVNEADVTSIMIMGFTAEAATRALLKHGGEVEAAVAWLVERHDPHMNDPIMDDERSRLIGRSRSSLITMIRNFLDTMETEYGFSKAQTLLTLCNQLDLFESLESGDTDMDDD